tara:strand:+ start:321 stop:1793 length:1473 start_codon:yes stop_codon:yes gene_type:complete
MTQSATQGTNFQQFYKFKSKPYKHQFDAWLRSKDEENFALFMEMGTGKSKVTIDNFAYLYDQGKIDSVLLVAPKGVYRNWIDREIPKHLPDHIRYTQAIWTAAKSKSKIVELNNILKGGYDLRILVMNVEAFSTGNGKSFAKKFVNSGKCFITIDESTTIKNHSAQRTKSIMSVGIQAKYRRILSGLPVTNSPMDLYSQCKFLDEHLLGFSSYYSFRNRYALMNKLNLGGRAFTKVVGYQRLNELEDKIKSFSERTRKVDCLDLPDKVYETVEVVMPPKQKKYYDEMRQQAITTLEEGDCTPVNVLSQMIRLHQISCGHVVLDDGYIVRTSGFRLDTLMDIIEDLPNDNKVIIWATYRDDIRVIVDKLEEVYGKSVVQYHGGVKDADRTNAIESFQDASSGFRFFVGNPQTGGMGITLTASSTVIYYSNSYNLEHRIQSEDRAHRIGQTNKVTYVDLICRKTIDEKIVTSLINKKSVASSVLGDDWKDWL